MKNVKRKPAQFTFYDRTGIQKDLEKMAEKGWMLEKITSFYWQYRRIEPKKLHFAVTYFPKGSEFDPEPTEGQKSLIGYCSEVGWKYVGSTAQLQIFYSEEENPIPIDTDANVELQNIHRSAKGNYLIVYSLLLGLYLLNLGLNVWDFIRDPLSVLESNAKLFSIFCYIAVVLMCTVELIGYFIWYRKAKKAAETDGSFVPTKSTRKFQFMLLTIVLVVAGIYIFTLTQRFTRFIMLASLLWGIVLYVTVNLVKNILKKHKVPREMTRAAIFAGCSLWAFVSYGIIIWIAFRVSDLEWFQERKPVGTYEYYGGERDIYHDELLLRVEDMVSMESPQYTYEKRVTDSLFLQVSRCEQRSILNKGDGKAENENKENMPELRYHITEVKIPWLYDFCVDAVIDEFCDEDSLEMGYYLKETDAEIWGAERVYQYCDRNFPMNHYLVCYEEHYAVVIFYWTPSEEQIRTAGEKLKGL